MAVNLQDVVNMAEGLTDDQKAELVVWLLDRIKTHELTAQERQAIFDSMTVDLGPVLPSYSDQREDWYDDAH
ncbi:MAG: hypothetical protein IT320_26895 [Anaerolineae bacterium]|nr:hypothetical protein [Anaerolineae bacterium]